MEAGCGTHRLPWAVKSLQQIHQAFTLEITFCVRVGGWSWTENAQKEQECTIGRDAGSAVNNGVRQRGKTIWEKSEEGKTQICWLDGVFDGNFPEWQPRGATQRMGTLCCKVRDVQGQEWVQNWCRSHKAHGWTWKREWCRVTRLTYGRRRVWMALILATTVHAEAA